MINRRVNRTVLNATETTAKTNSINSDALSFVIASSDSFYIGFHGKFASRYFKMGVLNTNLITVAVSYWDGDSWEPVEDLVDQTLGFTVNGFIHWQNANNWAVQKLTPVSDVDLYWVRLKVSGSLSAFTSLQSVLNLFCDDDTMRVYYPELISDTRYLPPNRSDFLEQYLAAKDLVILRLKQRGLIQDESQVIDANQVCAASIHAAAKIILHPIASDEQTEKRKKDASDSFDNEMNELSLSVDANKDGRVTDAEREDFGSPVVTRR